MFKKKPTIKPLAPIRSSDRRRTADQIISDYGLQKPATDNASTEEKTAATNEHTTLRNSILPDNVQSARFTTTHGPELKQVSGTVYIGSHGGDEQRVLWFKIENTMYPTVYTLWRLPGLIPLLHTHEIVVNKIKGGADLMKPGLAGGPPFPERAKQGVTVAIASTERPSVPIAVGTCMVDVSAIQSVQGAKGHAVQTMHWAGDEIWSYTTSGRPGMSPPEDLPGWISEDTDVKDLAGTAADLDLDDHEEGGVALGGAHPISVGKDRKEDLEEEGDQTKNEEVLAKSEVEHMSTKEIDEAFRNAFVYGAHHHMTTNTSKANFGLDFPLTQSFVVSNLVQPFLPAFTPEQAGDLQMKNTSFKNIKKFIKSLDKTGIIKSKERDRHETTIIAIDFDDKAIAEFKPYRLPKKETFAGTSLGRGEKATETIDTGDSSVGQKLDIRQYYKSPERLQPIFAKAESTFGSSVYTASEVRSAVTSYIESEDLVPGTNKRLVKLNPILANSVFDGTQQLDTEVRAKGAVPRDALIDRITSACSPQHIIIRNGAASKDQKPKAGLPPRIKIVLETRSGNKTVTKVSGVESYYIPPQPLADELRKVCAGSSSVEQLAGSSPKTPIMEIMVQGPQKEAVIKALGRRGVRPQWMEVLDKTKGKKR